MLQMIGEPVMTARNVIGPGDEVEDPRTRVARGRIEMLRVESGISKIDLSRRIGMNDSYMSQFTSGKKQKTLTTDIAQRIAEVLGVSVRYIWGDTDDRYDTPRAPQRLTTSPRSAPIAIHFAGIVDSGVSRTMANIKSLLTERADDVIYDKPFSTLSEADHFYVDVNDDDMAGYSSRGRPKPICRGMIAVYVSFAALGVPPEPGRVYVVERSRDGLEWKTLLRRAVEVFPDRVIFSSAPANGPVETFEAPLSGNNFVKIKGRAYRWSFNDED